MKEQGNGSVVFYLHWQISKTWDTALACAHHSGQNSSPGHLGFGGECPSGADHDALPLVFWS